MCAVVERVPWVVREEILCGSGTGSVRGTGADFVW
jgi:hypothetical protein